MIFAITSETKAVSRVPFDLDAKFKAYKAGEIKTPFHLATLNSVSVVSNVKEKYTLLPEAPAPAAKEKPKVEHVTPESLNHGLRFNFIDEHGVAEFTKTIWAIEGTDKKDQQKAEIEMRRLALIFDTFVGHGAATKYLTAEVLLKDAKHKQFKDYLEYFTLVANVFNTGDEGKPVFTDKLVWLKLVRSAWNDKRPNDIEFGNGNCIERFIPDAITSILIVDANDVYLSKEIPKATPVGVPQALPGMSGVPKPGAGWGSNI